MITKTSTKATTKSRLKPNPKNLRRFLIDYSSWASAPSWEQAERQNEAFRVAATNILRRRARLQEFVHVNDFWDAVERQKSPIQEPEDMRLLGQVFRALAKEGVISATDMAKKSDRFGSYWRTVWRSNIYVPKVSVATSSIVPDVPSL